MTAEIVSLTYEVLPGRKGIKCLRCGQTSYSKGDLVHLFCADCGYHPATYEQMHPDEQGLLRALAVGETHLSRVGLVRGNQAYTFRLLEGLHERRFIDLDPSTNLVKLTLLGWASLGGAGVSE